MKISEIYQAESPIFSFEFFPPKTDAGAENLMATVADLQAKQHPHFISVTYGAGGATRERTLQVVARIQNELKLTTMAHLSCVGSTRTEISEIVARLTSENVKNVLALRGDPPQGETEFEVPEGGFGHATELIEYLAEHSPVDIGAACYPESHPESSDPEDDLKWTKEKAALGANFLITQIFFDNRHYYDFLQRARGAGIRVPIIPGIMPITNVAQIDRFTELCGSTIPPELEARLRRVADDPGAVMAAGIEQAIGQCRELLSVGAPGLHFYTLNKSHATRSVLAALQ